MSDKIRKEGLYNHILSMHEFSGILNNLNEIILQSNTNKFRFNAYILKMIIVKCEYVMSQIQLAEVQPIYDIYNKISKARIDIICILDDLISPF
jgi:hypothetical protein